MNKTLWTISTSILTMLLLVTQNSITMAGVGDSKKQIDEECSNYMTMLENGSIEESELKEICQKHTDAIYAVESYFNVIAKTYITDPNKFGNTIMNSLPASARIEGTPGIQEMAKSIEQTQPFLTTVGFLDRLAISRSHWAPDRIRTGLMARRTKISPEDQERIVFKALASSNEKKDKEAMYAQGWDVTSKSGK